MSLYYDQAGLSGATLNEVNDYDDLLGVGSHFRWRLRITSADARRFFLGSREVVANLHSSQLPGTFADFRQYLDGRCPNLRNRVFRMRCSAWGTSPYQLVPVQFTGDMWFKASQDVEQDAELAGRETEAYQKLLDGCRSYTRSRPKITVDFEIKVFFLKVGEVIPEQRRRHAND